MEWRRGGEEGFLGARVQGGQEGFHTLEHSKWEFQVRVNKREQQEEPCGEGWPRPSGAGMQSLQRSLPEGGVPNRKEGQEGAGLLHYPS